MIISKNCVDLVKRFEGCYLTGYICPAGKLTIGYGHTGSVDGIYIYKGMKISQEKAEALLRKDLQAFEAHVNKFNNKYKWNQNEFDALVSFAFNVGSINQLTQNGTRTKHQIALKIPEYNKAAGKILPGLSSRRAAEKALFLTPETKKEAPEVVEDSKMIVNGKEVKVKRILKDGANYIKIRDIAEALNMEISASGNIPVLKTK